MGPEQPAFGGLGQQGAGSEPWRVLRLAVDPMLPLVMRFSARPSLLCRPALGGRVQPQLRAHRTAGLFRRGGAGGVRAHPGAPGPAAAVGPALTPRSLRLKPHHRQHSGKSQTLAQGFAWTEVVSGPRNGRGAVRGRGDGA